MKILYFLGILTFLAVYNFVEKSHKIWQEMCDKIDHESYQIEIDQILKDDDLLDNAWEKSGQFEGDIILNDAQKEKLFQMADSNEVARNSISNLYSKWPNNVLVYKIINEYFNASQIRRIHRGFDTISNVSCVKFRQSHSQDKNVVKIVGKYSGCMSRIGLQGGDQILNLDSKFRVGKGCFTLTSVVHELLHALGFYHMHNNPNRDDYIRVEWKNIKPEQHVMFYKENAKLATDFGLEYDYNSIMHYSTNAYSKNGNDTLIPIKKGAVIERHRPISEFDIKKLNLLYCS